MVEGEKAEWVRVVEGCRACVGLHRWEKWCILHHWAYLAEIYAHNSVSWLGLIVILFPWSVVDRCRKSADPDSAWSASGTDAVLRCAVICQPTTGLEDKSLYSVLHALHPSTSHLRSPIMTLVYKPEPGDALIPRQYQEEIFFKAQQRNVIAVLDTGSGKTLISALLIKWVATQECPQKKVVVFLVPKVPLVEQQGNFVARHTALRVAQVHSEVSAGVMDRTRWSNLFSQADVLVMTGERISIQ